MKLLCFLLICAGLLHISVLGQDGTLQNSSRIKDCIKDTLGNEGVNILFNGPDLKKEAPNILRDYITKKEKILIPSALAALVSAIMFGLETNSPSNCYALGATVCTLGVSGYFVSTRMPKFLAAKKIKDMIDFDKKKNK